MSRLLKKEIDDLAALGVSADEVRVYEALVQRAAATAAELARDCRWPPARVSRVIAALKRKALVSRSTGAEPRYVATPPDVGIEALILQRQESLQRARIAATRLQEQAIRARSARAGDETVIEFVVGREAQGKVFEQLQLAACKEVIAFDRPPYIWSPQVNVNPVESQVLARRVRVRSVYDGRSLEMPGAAGRIRACVEQGEEARAFPSLPLKLVAADHRVAMLPLKVEHPEGAALLVRSSSLLDALYELFESVWERAAPIGFADGEDTIVLGGGQDSGAEADQLTALLSSGLNDKSIAHQLGISARTLDRRIDALLQGLNARTRFQAGWQAGLRRAQRR